MQTAAIVCIGVESAMAICLEQCLAVDIGPQAEDAHWQ
jgi:hypothetical protein